MRLLVVLAIGLGGAACAGPQEDSTRVFVRDPRQVWVEAWTDRGESVLLPAGGGFHGVTVRADMEPGARVASFASIFREPSGAITIDHRACAPWPESPLSSRGVLTVPRTHGDPGLEARGDTLRVPFKCQTDSVTVLDLAFVTPRDNVKEVRLVDGASERPVAPGSSDPALQGHP